MRVLIKLEIRRQAEHSDFRTRLSDSGQSDQQYHWLWVGFFRNCRFRCCCGLNQANIPHDHSGHRNYGPQGREVDDARVNLDLT